MPANNSPARRTQRRQAAATRSLPGAADVPTEPGVDPIPARVL